MKNPVVFLLQFFAWLMLIAVLLVSWAGATYPSGRTKAYPPEFSKIHPMCIHRVLIDEKYESSTNLAICQSEYKNHPITIQTIAPALGDKPLIQVTSTSKSKDGDIWVVGYSMANDDEAQVGPFLINLFHKFPNGTQLSSLAGVSVNSEDQQLSAHFLEGGNDRCQGGYIEVMGMASRTEIALSQASTLYALLNPLGQLLRRSDENVHTTFPDWQAEETISDNPSECVGRLIGVFDHVSEIASVTAIAVDLEALLRQSRNTTEACVSDAIVRAKTEGSITSGSFTVYGLDHWNEILNYVHRRCGVDKAFNPINSGI